MPGNPFGFPACIMKKFIPNSIVILDNGVFNLFPSFDILSILKSREELMLIR